MIFPHNILLTILFSLSISFGFIQAQPAQPKQETVKTTVATVQQSDDYSQEALVIEQLKVRYQFEKDGTGQHELSLRVRVQTEGALQRFGQLAFSYVSANENLEIDYVRVKKPDGTVVTAPPSSIQDLTAPISRDAPVYTDVRQKHITVPGLRPGDTLEYHIVWKRHTPLAANHFWLNHDFVTNNVIVLDEQLEVDIPAASTVKLKTEKGFDPVIKEQSGRRVYTWKHALLKREEEKDDDKNAARARREELENPKPPQVQITTFKNWDEVGQWYSALERERIVPDDRIRAKVEELLRDKKTDEEKIEALYEFVAKSFRYVSLSLGQGRYQPQAASAVLTNQYGDCKDKHTLLTSMLIAAGFHAYPALMNSSRKIDEDVPSPGQFDHVISAIPLGSRTLWADTTAEVAPFGLLNSALRNKASLLISANAPARIETTPAEPPFVSLEDLKLEGQVTELGKLTGHASLRLHGDAETYFRTIFRRTPKSEWKQLGYFLSGSIGVRGGEVSGIKTSDPEALHTPFEVSFDFSKDDFLDWSAKKLALDLPLPDVTLVNVDADKEESAKPIQIGVPIDVTYRLQLTLPAKYQMRAPVQLKLNRDYATYASTYKVEGNVFTAERTYHSTLHELVPARTPDYRAFAAAARADAAQTLSLETTSVAGTPAMPDLVKAEDLLEAARAAVRNQNFTMAETLLRRVLEKEPTHKTVRSQLGYVLLAQRKLEDAIEVMREQTKINPYDEYAYNVLGRALWRQQKYAEAEATFRKEIEIAPLDKFVHGNLGLLLVQWRKYKDAIPELEQAISLNPDDEDDYQLAIGRAYLNLNEVAKGNASFDRAVKLAPNPHTWNNVAYYLAIAKVELDRAQQYAESAVTEVATKLRNAELERLTGEDLEHVDSLAAYWDTLGWVYFQKGDLDTAEKYITASWRLAEHGEVGYHLGQILEKRGKTDEATRVYARAVGATNSVPEARDSLVRLVGKEKSEALMASASNEAKDARTISLGAAGVNVKGTTEARFFVVLAPDATRKTQVAGVKFISGDEKLRPLADQLKSANFGLVFPDDKITKIIRRGTLSCLSKNGECSFIMMSPDFVPLD
jgi:tetratricopeptide (TPR) repeat protein